MLKRLLFILLMPLLCQCASQNKHPQKIILKHPDTHDFKTCSGEQWQDKESFKVVEECIHKYRSLGYRVWGQR